MAIVKEQGFELNTNARNLKQTHSNNILVIVRGTHNELFAALVERLQTVASGGASTSLWWTIIGELDNEVQPRGAAVCASVKPAGHAASSAAAARISSGSFAEIHIPAVRRHKLRRGIPVCKNLSSVTTDDTAAAAAAGGVSARTCGHRKHRRASAASATYSDTGRLRYAGVLRRASRAARHDVRRATRYYKTAPLQLRRAAIPAMAELLRETSEITAVFAMADVIAIGAARAVRACRKAHPGGHFPHRL